MGLCGHKQYEKLQVIQNKIILYAYYEGRYASNESIHIALDVRTLNEEIKRAPAKLYQRIRQHDNPMTAAVGNYDIHVHYCTRPKQNLH
jgi:hypothetical protein